MKRIHSALSSCISPIASVKYLTHFLILVSLFIKMPDNNAENKLIWKKKKTMLVPKQDLTIQDGYLVQLLCHILDFFSKIVFSLILNFTQSFAI